MKRLLSRIIKVPDLEVNVNDPVQEERLMRARDYVLRTAIPTVDDYILQPFTGELKDEALELARRQHGVDEHGLLKDSASKEFAFEGIVLTASAGPALSTSYEQVIADMQSCLRRVHGRKSRGVEHVNAASLRSEFVHFFEEASTPYNRLEARLDSAPECDVKELTVMLDSKQYATPSQKAAIEFVKARSLRGNLVAFASAIETELSAKYGVTGEGAEINQELSDESGVRYLFFPKTTTEYGEVFRGLVGQKTGKISSSNGDLDVLLACAFKGDYHHAQGKIDVSTISEHGAGVTTITRHLKSGEDVRKYRVVKHNGVHVAIEDVQVTLGALLKEKSATGMSLKVDFFPAYK